MAGLRLSLGAALLLAALPLPGQAQTPYTVQPQPSLTQSLALAQAALEVCQSRGYAASVAVVDSAGRVKLVLRADDAPKPPVAAPRKAAAAAHYDLPGSVMMPRSETDAAFAAELAAHKDIYNPHPGSLPLHENGRLIGGLAVADVPHEVADACARTALKTAGQGLN
ncbi:heme-binding protein [Asticcacaulis sp. EMRT-3]|uniref:heme-binding protein n=1 Tax=Asticcacaulis sp. EMRT-3 TaxID=3040349 RepID=UPI0024AEE971|nr:heme-binding protein [Asticcacaulis sp. EMRT-3]MDI7773923.1 heme-binding protein [Asticcacaulis sp. EMRT-3]